MNVFTQIKVTYINKKNNQDEIHFDYYNKENEIVGTVSVTKRGKLEWNVWDNDYLNIVLSYVSYINGNITENTIEHVLYGRLPIKGRWSRIQEIIAYKGLIVNFKEDNETDEKIASKKK